MSEALEGRTIYISGPITGIPGKNHELFKSVATQLRNAGNRVYNPREFTWDEPVFPKRRAFAEYCAFICNEATTIVMLPGWQKSKGATTEHGLAENCSLEIIEWADWQDFFKFTVLDAGGGV